MNFFEEYEEYSAKNFIKGFISFVLIIIATILAFGDHLPLGVLLVFASAFCYPLTEHAINTFVVRRNIRHGLQIARIAYIIVVCLITLLVLIYPKIFPKEIKVTSKEAVKVTVTALRESGVLKDEKSMHLYSTKVIWETKPFKTDSDGNAFERVYVTLDYSIGVEKSQYYRMNLLFNMSNGCYYTENGTLLSL